MKDFSEITGGKPDDASDCIALLERGRSEANITTLIALSKVFRVSIDYLLGLEDTY